MSLHFLEPWLAIEDREQASVIHDQLVSEVTENHVLSGIDFDVIGIMRSNDDILILLHDSRVAAVHLTWSDVPHESGTWPRAEIFASFDQWRDERMVPAHKEWLELG